MALVEGLLSWNPALVLFFILIITFCIYFYLHESHRPKLPPGPKPWPIIGNLLELNKTKQWCKLFLQYKKEYGDLFTIYIGPQPTVILGSLDKVREALIHKQNEFAGRPQTYTGELFAENKDIIFGQYTPVWQQQRKLAFTAMRKYATGEHLEDLVFDSFSRLKEGLDSKAKTGEAFDPQMSASLLIYNIISAMTFGKVYELDDPFFNELIKRNEELIDVAGDGLLGDIWPILKYIPTAGVKATKHLSEIFDKYLDDTIKEHEDTYNPDSVTDLTYHLIHTRKKMEEEEGSSALHGLTSVHFRGILVDVFFAGTDTSRYTILWALLYLANYPEVQRKAQQEIDAIIDEGDVIRSAQKAMLSYTDAVLHEVMRIRTLIPLAIQHLVLKDTTIGDYELPKGTQVLPFTWALHMDPEHWSEPEEFRPERFLDEDGKLAPRISAWLPFSTGRRVCVGESAAKVELLLSLTYLLKHFTFKPPGGQKIEPNFKDLGVMTLPVPFKLVVEHRNQMTSKFIKLSKLAR